MKILVIGDIHLGKSRESTTREKIVRQANSEAEEMLKLLIPSFNQANFNLVIHMGDSLRDIFDKETDRQNTLKTLRLLQKINCPQIHLLGNHELMAFNTHEIKQIYQTAQIDQDFYGMMNLEDLQLVWLDLELDEQNGAYLSNERLTWLKQLPKSEKPLVILSHYATLPINQRGNFYFENKPERIHYQNIKEINEVLDKKKANLCLSAHIHMLAHQVLNKTHYISAPSFSENIAAQDHPQNNPGVFSILEIEKNEFIFSSYSKDFCFAKIQGKLAF